MYVEVPDKRKWWAETVAKAEPLAPGDYWTKADFADDDSVLPVAFIDKGMFVALAVLWSPREYQRVVGGRPDAVVGLVPKAILRGVVPGGEKLKELR